MSKPLPETKWKTIKTTRVWAMIRPDGSVIADSGFKTEEDVWQICLGWPSDDEIELAKKNGHIVTQVTIIR